MTTIQDQILDEAMTKLGEHFEHVVIIADAPDVEFPEEDSQTLFTRHKGSTWTCVGMMKVYSKLMWAHFQGED